MDVVIPLGKGSKWENMELRFALRGISKFIPNSRIVIIGECPGFLQNVLHIPAGDDPNIESKERNIMRKVLLACDHPEVSDDFLFTNDDIFILQRIPEKLPYYYDKSLERKIQARRGVDHYHRAMVNTFNILKAEGLPAMNYDIHYPVIYNKTLFRDVMKMYDWSVQDGYVVKSLYCNTLEVQGVKSPDYKLAKRMMKRDVESYMKGKQLFSIADSAINSQLKYALMARFPEKCRFEK